MKTVSRLLAVFTLVVAVFLNACGPGSPPAAAPAAILDTSSSQSTVDSSAPSEQVQPPSSSEVPSSAPTSLEAALSENILQKGNNPFTTAKDELYDLYLFHPQNLTYSQLGNYFYAPRETPDHPIALALNALPTLPKEQAKPGAAAETGFLIVREDYQKTQVNLLEQALEVDGIVYTLTPAQYQQLKELAEKAAEENFDQYAQWLVWMNPSRITAMEYTDAAGKKHHLTDRVWSILAEEFRLLPVTGGVTQQSAGKVLDKDGQHVLNIGFDSGVEYTIVLDGSTLYVQSSDVNSLCRYQIGWPENLITEIEAAARGELNPRTGKPVIYLYPQQTQEVSVKLHFNGALSYTYPAYGDGWRVTAEPDGRLTNHADASTHYYLFWDGTANFRDWDFSQGFVVKGSETEAFFLRTLPAMGLTPREYNDFITYWTPLLMQNPYNLITFATAQYEAIAPLTIAPMPDTLLRVHMVYRPLTKAVEVAPQALPKPPKRSGFTVVEWGGTRAD